MVICQWLSYSEECRPICKLECRGKWGVKGEVRLNTEPQIREIKSSGWDVIKDEEDVRGVEVERVITEEAVLK